MNGDSGGDNPEGPGRITSHDPSQNITGEIAEEFIRCGKPGPIAPRQVDHWPIASPDEPRRRKEDVDKVIDIALEVRRRPPRASLGHQSGRIAKG